MFHDIHFLEPSSIKVEGTMLEKLRFVIKDQLKDVSMWKKFVEPYKTKEDKDAFWRGEFYGKEMRGASLAYRVTQDEELYNILTDAALDMLSAQEENGRISTYPVEVEFSGWDMWCRKYVLTGLLHYYDICKDEALKERIIAALKRHLDYIVDHIGKKEDGKKEITETSSWWGCVNSCTILEPTLALYRLTKEERYMDFAKYIISTGGCHDCNLIELALENKLSPYQYPVTKAYEMMSFYEGLLAYYEITGEKKYFEAVRNFIENVALSDLTVIGCSGCTHELFDHSSVMQTEPHENIMQETCVSVTWMRLSARLFFLTGEAKYLDRIEESGFNDLYGALNTEHQDQHNLFTKQTIEAMTFDSYSPLYDKERGQGTGGYMEFETGGHSGCCVAIGACGIALMPLMAALEAKEGLILSLPFKGEIKTEGNQGSIITIHLESDYPSTQTLSFKLEGGKVGEEVSLFFRKPIDATNLALDGEPLLEEKEEGFASVSLKCDEKEHLLSFERFLRVRYLNSKASFSYGSLTLAADEAKCDIDLTAPIAIAKETLCKLLSPKEGEYVRLSITLEDGKELLLTDYESCGKRWNDPKNKITVWFNLAK